MVKGKKGSIDGSGKKFGIAISRFNEYITQKLLEGCHEGLIKNGVNDEDILVCWVPGAFEIPFCAQRLARSKKFDAIICLGAVIRGETPHFDYICRAASRGIARTSLDFDIPVIFGLLTADTPEQAHERAGGGKRGNKGFDSALAAIEMANLF